MPWKGAGNLHEIHWLMSGRVEIAKVIALPKEYGPTNGSQCLMREKRMETSCRLLTCCMTLLAACAWSFMCIYSGALPHNIICCVQWFAGNGQRQMTVVASVLGSHALSLSTQHHQPRVLLSDIVALQNDWLTQMVCLFRCLPLFARSTPPPADTTERLDVVLGSLVDVDTIMSTMPGAIRNAVARSSA